MPTNTRNLLTLLAVCIIILVFLLMNIRVKKEDQPFLPATLQKLLNQAHSIQELYEDSMTYVAHRRKELLNEWQKYTEARKLVLELFLWKQIFEIYLDYSDDWIFFEDYMDQRRKRVKVVHFQWIQEYHFVHFFFSGAFDNQKVKTKKIKYIEAMVEEAIEKVKEDMAYLYTEIYNLNPDDLMKTWSSVFRRLHVNLDHQPKFLADYGLPPKEEYPFEDDTEWKAYKNHRRKIAIKINKFGVGMRNGYEWISDENERTRTVEEWKDETFKEIGKLIRQKEILVEHLRDMGYIQKTFDYEKRLTFTLHGFKVWIAIIAGILGITIIFCLCPFLLIGIGSFRENRHNRVVNTDEVNTRQKISETRRVVNASRAEFQQGTLWIPKRYTEDSYTFPDKGYSLGNALGIVNRSYRHQKIIACVDRNNKTTIIVYLTEICFDKEVQSFVNQYSLLIKHPLCISSEAFKVNQHAAKNGRVFTLEEEQLIRCCIDENSEKLWKSHSNLQMILADSYRYHKGKIIEDKCIVLYCLSKGFIPVEEECFPTVLYCSKGCIKVDVREGFFKLGPSKGMSDVWNDPICMGCSISAENGQKIGSLGVFVDLPGGRKGFITCYHVLFNIDSHSSGDKESSIKVCQPASSMFHNGNGNTMCGSVQKSVFCPNGSVSIDAALVLVTSRMPSTGHFIIRNDQQLIESGYTRTNYPYFTGGKVLRDISSQNREKRVLKSGNSTGLTTGVFKLNGVHVSIVDEYLKENTKSQKIKMCGQYEIISPDTFFDLGDSGAAVFLKEPDGKLSCIGIAIGKTSGNSTIVTPIGPIIDSLGLTDDSISKLVEPMDM